MTTLRDLPEAAVQLLRVAVSGERPGLVVRYPDEFVLMRFGDGGDLRDIVPILPGVRDASNLVLMDNNGDGRGEWQVHRRLPPDGAAGSDVYR